MRRLVLIALGFVGGLVGCSDVDVLTAEFSDDLVEAQARTVELKVVDDADCSTLLRVEHAEIESVANVIAVRSTGYPIDPESDILRDLPRGRPLIFDVSVVDAEARQVARACEGVTLPTSGSTEVAITPSALPTCESTADALDLVFVFDASIAMRNATISLGGSDALVDRLTPLFDSGISPGGDRWTLVVHGPASEPQSAVALTDDRLEVLSAVEQAATNLSGPSRLYDAIRLGTIVARSRAVCGRQQALIVLAGGPDEGPRGGRELALAGLDGDRGRPDDDLYAVGIGISAAGKQALDLVIVDDFGSTQAALTADGLGAAMLRTRERLQGLIGL